MPLSFLSRLALLLLVAGLVSCRPAKLGEAEEVARVGQTFSQFKSAVFGAHAGVALRYVDQASLDYLNSAGRTVPDPAAPDAEVTEVLHAAITRTTPGGVGPGFTIEVPLQRILNQGCMNTHAFDSIRLGSITVEGAKAHAEALWDGLHTTYQISFVEEGGVWKIDLLGILPYVEIGMRVGRALHNETEAQQVDRLVSQFPAP